MTTHVPVPVGVRAQGGPPLWLPALVFAVLTLLGVVVSVGTPQPSAAAEAVLSYQLGHVATMRLAAFCWFASAVPLAIWAATAYRRLRMLGVTAPGTAIGLAGGLLSAGSLSLLGLVTWTRTQGVGDPDFARAWADLGFALGATGYAAPFALLIAGVAVPSLILRLLPRWLAWAGLVIAAIGMVSTGTLLTPVLDVTLPITRFGGLIWLVPASFLLPRTRRRLAVPPVSAAVPG